MLLECYSNATQMLLKCYSNATQMLLKYSKTHPNLKVLVEFHETPLN